MASSRELWIVLRARDEASRVISTFSKNVRAAALRAQAAAKSTEAQRMRQLATETKWNSELAKTANQYRINAASLLNLAAVNDRALVAAKDYRDTILANTGATQAQIDTVNRHVKSLEDRSRQLKADAKVQQALSAQARAQNEAVVRDIDNQARVLDGQANALRASANAAEQHDLKLRAMGQTISRVSEMATVSSFAFLALGITGAVAMKKMVDAAVEYERQVRATATQVDGFKGNLKELGDIGIRTANDIGVSFDQIQPALFDIFSSMEVNTKDAEKLLRSFSKAAVAGQTDIQEVSRATIGLLNAFHRPASDVNKILDIQFQLVQEGIGTYEEWNQRIGLVTPSAVRAGQSIEIMVAALAASTRMGMSAARSGTSVARAMDAMSHPAAVKNMEKLGVTVRDANGKFLPMNVTLRSFRDILNKMPEKDRVAAILEVFKGAGGTIEARRFIQNILLGKNNLELFDQILGEVQGSAGSMDKAYATMADSVAVKTELLKNKWNILKITLGEALMPQFSILIDWLQKVLDWFNKLPDGTKNIIAQFILWGSVISIAIGALLGLVAVIAVVVAAFVTIGTTGAIIIGVLTLIPIAIAAVAAAFIAAYKSSESFRNIINNTIDTLKSLWSIVTDTANQIKNMWDSTVVPAFNRLRDAIEQNVLPIIKDVQDKIKSEFIPRFQEAARIVRDELGAAFIFLRDRIDNDVIPAMQELKAWWEDNKASILPFITALGQVIKWLLILGGAIIAGVIAGFALLMVGVMQLIGVFTMLWDAGKAVVNFFIMLWGWIQQLPGWFMTAVDAVGNFINAVIAWFAALPGRVMSFIQGLPEMLWNMFTNMLNQAAYIVGYGFGLIIRFFADFVPRALQWIIGMIPRLGALWMTMTSNAWGIVSSGFNRVVTFIGGLPARAGAALSQLGPRVWNMFTGAWSRAQTATNNGINNVVNFVGGLPARIGAFAGRMFSAGWDLIMGMVNGVQSAAGRLWDAAVGAVESAIDGAMDALRIGSPSKVFFDIGVNTIQGMINGLDKMSRPLYNTMHDIASGMDATVNVGANVGTGTALGGAQNNQNGTSKQVNQYITIHTNEIDPRLTAAQLGFELQNRM